MKKLRQRGFLLLIFLIINLSLGNGLKGTAKTPIFTGINPPDAIDDLIAKANENEYWHPSLGDIRSIQIVIEEKYSDVEGLSTRLASIAAFHLPTRIQKIIGGNIQEVNKLYVQITCKALAKEYPEGLLYTGALAEGKILLEANGFKLDENFMGKIEPPAVLSDEMKANLALYKNPKNAPFNKALFELPGSYIDKLARIYYKAFGIYTLSAMIALGDPTFGTYYKALDPLIREVGEPLLEPFLYLLNSRLEQPSLISARILALLRSPKAIPALISASVEKWWISKEFDEALKTLGKESGGVEELLAYLKDKKASVRAKSAEILGFIGGDKAVEGLICALEDKDVDVRRCSSRSLYLLKDKKSVPALIKVLENPYEDEEVILWAIRALGEIKDQKAIESLRKISRRAGQLYELNEEAEKAIRNIPLQPVSLEQAISNWRIAVEHNAEQDVQGWEKVLEDCGPPAVEYLLPIAEDCNAEKELRISALRVLSKIKDDRPYQLYLEIAQNENEPLTARFYAIRGLGNCPTREASDFLIRTLARREMPEVLRCASAYALGEKKEKRAIEILYFVFEYSFTFPKEKDYDLPIDYWLSLQQEAAYALVKIGEPAIERIKDALRDERPDKRLIMFEALSKSEEGWTEELLSSALLDPAAEVRLWASEYYIEKKSREKTVMDTLLSILEEEASPYEKDWAIRLIKDLPHLAKGEEYRQRLAYVLKDYLKFVRVKYGVEYRESVINALEILGYLKDVSTVDVIAPFLRSNQKIIKEMAMETLTKIGTVNGVLDDLIYITKNDPRPDIRRKAVETLGKLRDPRGVQAIVDALRYDPDDTVHIGALEALKNWQSPEIVESLVSYLLQCEDVVKKKEIAEILTKMDRAKAVNIILRFLKNENPAVRGSAAEALGLMQAWEGVEALIELLTDDDAKVRDFALNALQEMAHNSYGYDIGKWRAWWEAKKEELIKRGELK